MQCPNCGALTSAGAGFCSTCGRNLAIVPPTGFAPAMPYAQVPPRTSGMAIAGLICAFFFSLLGLIFSIMGHNECKRSAGTVDGDGLAIAGIVISAIGLLVWIIYIIAIIAVVGSAHTTHYY